MRNSRFKDTHAGTSIWQRLQVYSIRYQGAVGLIILLILASFPIGFYAAGVRFSLYNANFRTWDNLASVLEQVSITGVLAVGMTFVILTGGIDLSVGAGLAFSSCAAALWIVGHVVPVPVILLLTITLGSCIGGLSGIVITRSRLQPFIVTLALMVSLRGMAYVITNGTFVSGVGHALDFFRASILVPVPRPLQGVFGVDQYWNKIPLFALFFLGSVFVAQALLTRTRFGRYVVSIGGGELVSHLSGVPVNAVKTAVYALNGALVGLAALMYTARTQSGMPGTAVGYELQAIAAVVIGGTALTGGSGSVTGTLIGTLFIGVLDNALQLNGVDYYKALGLQGPIILLAVMLQQRAKR